MENIILQRDSVLQMVESLLSGLRHSLLIIHARLGFCGGVSLLIKLGVCLFNLGAPDCLPEIRNLKPKPELLEAD